MPDQLTNDNRKAFVGRVNELRLFGSVLEKVLKHQSLWKEQAKEIGEGYDPAYDALEDDSYPRIFILHGIGGIGKTWLTRELLANAEKKGEEAQLLTCYCDVSIGYPPVRDRSELLWRVARWLEDSGYSDLVALYHQAGADAPSVRARVAKLAEDRRDLFQQATELAGVAAGQGAAIYAQDKMGVPLADGSEELVRRGTSSALNKTYDAFLGLLQGNGEITAADAALFRDPLAVQAEHLASSLRVASVDGPFVIAFDTLEVVPHLEVFLRDQLVVPLVDAPILWVLSGRYDLSTERLAEYNGERHVHKGYGDLLGNNPPVTWDVTSFSDADIRTYMTAEAKRRSVTLEVDDAVVAAIKSASGGVPLAVEMTVDALFALPSSDFLSTFKVDDPGLLSRQKLEMVIQRFLRYCLDFQDRERVYALALLSPEANDLSLRAVWQLPPSLRVTDALAGLRSRYGFMRGNALHDVVYDLTRRQLRTGADLVEVRLNLGARARSSTISRTGSASNPMTMSRMSG